MRPRRALYKGTGTAAGSQIAIGAGFDLSSAAEGTRVAWQGEASVFDKLAKLTSGMLEPVVKRNIQKLIDGLRWALYVPPCGAIAKRIVSEAERVVSAEEILVEQPAASKELPPASAEADTSTSCSKRETRN